MQQFEVGLESLIDPELVKLSIEDAGRDVEHMHCTLSVLIIFSSAFLLLANLMAPWRDLFSLCLGGSQTEVCGLFSNSKFFQVDEGQLCISYCPKFLEFDVACSKAI